MIEIPAPEFNLERTLHSGQVFHWLPHGEGFVGCIGDEPLCLQQRGQSIRTARRHAELAYRYLSLDHPIRKIVRSFPNDPTMRAALEFSRGTRIIRQPVWECLATFITSALKQVAHIRAISLAVRRSLGRRMEVDGEEVYSYPRPEVVAGASLDLLLSCKLGFRAKNLLYAAQMIAAGDPDLEELRDRSTDQIRTELCRLPGVGAKIANCVLLFAYERLEVVPVDVWIDRALREAYFSGRAKVSAAESERFIESYFGPFAGYAQQYLFNHWRLTYRKKR
jgi:N-glycosylase/DNA lyase